ncbi:methyl-accepting chemotaxis protein [Paenibacillus mesotrionivorans]|uniref:Methyl-accepting chemotaxis protein n=1 Tax=Paenibacillus mesotrionivorans TaxID=3160968 RepID=A0ACC7NV47_9BACL
MKLTIGRKLIGGFLAVACFMVIVIGLFYRSLGDVESRFHALVDERVKVLTHAQLIQSAGLQQNDYIREYYLTQTPASIERMAEANTRVISLVEETLPFVTSEEDAGRFERLKGLALDYKERVDAALAMPADKGLREAEFSVFPVATQLAVLAENLANDQLALMTEEQQEVKDSVLWDKRLALGAGIGATVLSLAIGFLIAYAISRPIRSITAAAREIAAGNLQPKKLEVRTKDEIQELSEAFLDMMGQLRGIIGKVDEGAAQLVASAKMMSANAEMTSAATQHITDAAQEVAAGSEQQVRGAEDSARAMEEMSQGITRIAESSAAVHEVTVHARQQADEGNAAAQHAVRQMNTVYQSANLAAERVKRLGERSGEIGEIIGVMSGIASQTSLLALNASIEAARAGEQGRGFVVVASEVKKLAIQSEEAARQITELIRQVQVETAAAVKGMQEGMVQSREGLAVVESAGEAFGSIRTAIIGVVTQIEEVSATAQEMSAGTQEVAASVEETSRIARQSSRQIQEVAATTEEQLASMQEITASAGSLNTMAEELQQAVSRFKL